MKDRIEIHGDVLDAIIDSVLRDVEKAIKDIRCDASAIDQEHAIGYLAGFRAAKRAILDVLST